MAYRTNYDVTVCAGGCGTRPAKGIINDLNRAWVVAHGWRCEEHRRERRASIAERKRTVAAHRRQQARIASEGLPPGVREIAPSKFVLPALLDDPAFQSDFSVVGDGPVSSDDQLGRAPAYRRGRGWGC
jgi:hypothetical protein